jgi:acyl dehydratase
MTNLLEPVRLTMSLERIRAYAVISNDFNPIHVDPDFAANTVLGGIIAHGTLSLNLVWQSIEQTFGSSADNASVVDIKFRVPVRENDRVEAGGERISPDTFNVWVKNQDGTHVLEGTATIHTGQTA